MRSDPRPPYRSPRRGGRRHPAAWRGTERRCRRPMTPPRSERRRRPSPRRPPPRRGTRDGWEWDAGRGWLVPCDRFFGVTARQPMAPGAGVPHHDQGMSQPVYPGRTISPGNPPDLRQWAGLCSGVLRGADRVPSPGMRWTRLPPRRRSRPAPRTRPGASGRPVVGSITSDAGPPVPSLANAAEQDSAQSDSCNRSNAGPASSSPRPPRNGSRRPTGQARPSGAVPTARTELVPPWIRARVIPCLRRIGRSRSSAYPLPNAPKSSRPSGRANRTVRWPASISIAPAARSARSARSPRSATSK